MRRHTLIGERIITAAPALGRAARLVRSSHEAFDGSGYPDGLAGDEIPLGARMIADLRRVRRDDLRAPLLARETIDEALAELRRCAGHQFDPAIVADFKQLMASARSSRPQHRLRPRRPACAALRLEASMDG